MRQRQTRLEPYDSTERNQRELERYRTMSTKELHALQQFWINRLCNLDICSELNRVNPSTEILALVKLAIAERIGKKPE